jgi:hypothetical protein
VTIPLPEPTVARLVLPDVHEPLPVASVSVIDVPGQKGADEPMPAGNGLIVTTEKVVQPVAVKVNVMFAVPGVTPVTTPVVEATVAIPVALLDHVPAPAGSLKAVVVPGQACNRPVIAAGIGLTTAAVV